MAQSSNASNSKILKIAAIIGASAGVIGTAIMYAYKSFSSGSEVAISPTERRACLKRELLNELGKYPIEPPKDQDYIMTKDFMITLFKILFTYQTIGREVVKEEILDRRIQHLRAGESDKWEAIIDSRAKEFQKVQMEMKDIVFDYFNIITKEYELAFEKWKDDPQYVDAITKIKL